MNGAAALVRPQLADPPLRAPIKAAVPGETERRIGEAAAAAAAAIGHGLKGQLSDNTAQYVG
jgi:hypothetical protein